MHYQQQMPQRPGKAAKKEYVNVMADSSGKKVFMSAAYGLGFGVGFFLLPMIAMDIDDEVKKDAISHVFHMAGLSFIAYSMALIIGLLVARAHIGAIKFILNWFVLPTFAINYLMQLYDILTKG